MCFYFPHALIELFDCLLHSLLFLDSFLPFEWNSIIKLFSFSDDFIGFALTEEQCLDNCFEISLQFVFHKWKGEEISVLDWTYNLFFFLLVFHLNRRIYNYKPEFARNKTCRGSFQYKSASYFRLAIRRRYMLNHDLFVFSDKFLYIFYSLFFLACTYRIFSSLCCFSK